MKNALKQHIASQNGIEVEVLTRRIEALEASIVELCEKIEDMGDDLLTKEGLSEWLDMPVTTCNKYRREGMLPYRMIGNRVFYRKREIIKAIFGEKKC